MTDPNVPIADAMQVIDHKAFGREIIRWALMRRELRPRTVGELRANFPLASAALYIPAHVADNNALDLVQGTPTTHHFDLPPLYKLLPMLEYLEESWSDYNVPDCDLGFDPATPPSIPTVPGGTHYKVPGLYEKINDGTLVDIKEIFLHRVGDYSFNGCR